MKRTALWTLAVPILALAACSRMTTSQPSPATAEKMESAAEAKLCKDMTEKRAAIHEFPAISEETSLESVKQANQEAEKAVRDVEGYSNDINDPGVLQVKAAFQELQDAVNAVPGGRETVGESSTIVSQEAMELRTAWDSLYNKMQCGA